MKYIPDIETEATKGWLGAMVYIYSTAATPAFDRINSEAPRCEHDVLSLFLDVNNAQPREILHG